MINAQPSTVYNASWENVRSYPDGYFDLAICDIPYGIGVGKMAYLKEVKHEVTQKNGKKLNANRNKKPYTAKNWDSEPPTQAYFDELRRVSKHQIIFGIEYVDWTEVGTGRIKWDKGVAEGSSFSRYEVAYCSFIEHVHEVQLLWSGMFQAKSLNEPMTQQGNKELNEKRIHPCHKPTMLYELLILFFVKTLAIVDVILKLLDTHLGGGSSRIAARKFNFEFVGYEIDLEYFTAQEERYKDFTKQLTLW